MTEQVNKEAEQVSNKEESHIEIVTKEPTPPVNPPKMKDPKKIEAGKKLAAYNKKAKNSKKELKENSAGVVDEDSSTNQGGSGFNITLTTVVAIIGLWLTGVDLYLRHKKYNQKGVEDYKMEMVKNGETLDPTFIENIKKKKDAKRVRFEPGME